MIERGVVRVAHLVTAVSMVSLRQKPRETDISHAGVIISPRGLRYVGVEGCIR